MESTVLEVPTPDVTPHKPVSYSQLVTSPYSNEEVGLVSKTAECSF